MLAKNEILDDAKGAEEIFAEYYDEMMAEWLKVLSRLWTAIGKIPTSEQLEAYREALKDVPFGLLEKSIARVLREHKYNSVPTIGKVWDAFLKELDPISGMSIAENVERWDEQEWEKTIYRFQ